MAKFENGHKPYKAKLGKRRYKGAYILAYTNKRKNGKRHVVARYNDLHEALFWLKRLDTNPDKKKYDIYNTVWEKLT